jgi:hypothetical protein
MLGLNLQPPAGSGGVAALFGLGAPREGPCRPSTPTARDVSLGKPDRPDRVNLEVVTDPAP